MGSMSTYRSVLEALRNGFSDGTPGDAFVGRFAIRDGTTAANMAAVGFSPGAGFASDSTYGLTTRSILHLTTSIVNGANCFPWISRGMDSTHGSTTRTPLIASEAAYPEKVIGRSIVTILSTDVIGTDHNLDYDLIGRRAKGVWVNVFNGASDSALTITVMNEFSDGASGVGTLRYGTITSFGVAASGTVSVFVSLPGGSASINSGAAFVPAFRINVENDAQPAADRTVTVTVTGQDPAA